MEKTSASRIEGRNAGLIEASRLGGAGALFALAVLLVLLIVCAWQADDAFITWRTVENAVDGNGLRWNPDERVQVYSHPLWMVAGILCRLVSGELYFSILVLSIALAMGVAVGLLRLSGTQIILGICAVLALIGSKAFVDYAVSGLENPLTCALVVGLAFAVSRQSPAWVISLIGSFMALTRPDALLLALPVVLWSLRRDPPSRRAILLSLVGWLPLVAWESFSLVYYGALVPNTALAKLNLDIPRMELLFHGLSYLRDSLIRDPITVTAGLICAGLALRSRHAGAKALAWGGLLYMAYVVWIGGDFMSGRFWMVPLVQFLAAALVAREDEAPIARSGQAALVATLCIYGVLWPHTPVHTDLNYGEGLAWNEIVRDGIADERAYYFTSTGMLTVLAQLDELEKRDSPVPPYRGAFKADEFRQSGLRVGLSNEIGYFGYFVGTDGIVIDVWALCDPLLARIPFLPQKKQRIGHYPRPMPSGYLDSRTSGEIQFEDPGLGEAYRDIRRVVSGPIWDTERWAAIWRLHTGAHAEALALASHAPAS